MVNMMVKKSNKKRRNDLPDNFLEMYYVKFNVKKPDGYWVYGCQVYVEVLANVDNMKNNHAKAKALFLSWFPDTEIVSVSYV